MGQTTTVLGVIAAISVLLIVALYSRDYDLKIVDGRPRFVAEIGIPRPTKLSLNNTDPGHVTMTTGIISSVEGYQFRVSGNAAMILAKTYRTASISHTEANLKEGKTIYVQVRAYKTNEFGRTVYGTWSVKKNCKVK